MTEIITHFLVVRSNRAVTLRPPQLPDLVVVPLGLCHLDLACRHPHFLNPSAQPRLTRSCRCSHHARTTLISPSSSRLRSLTIMQCNPNLACRRRPTALSPLHLPVLTVIFVRLSHLNLSCRSVHPECRPCLPDLLSTTMRSFPLPAIGTSQPRHCPLHTIS
jgi:hypothetical protein